MFKPKSIENSKLASTAGRVSIGPTEILTDQIVALLCLKTKPFYFSRLHNITSIYFGNKLLHVKKYNRLNNICNEYSNTAPAEWDVDPIKLFAQLITLSE